MGLLTTADLQSIREEFTAVLDQTATIRRRTRGANVAGSKALTYEEVAEYPCRVQDSISSSEEGAKEGRETGEVVYTLVFPDNADIRSTDRVQISGVTYEIVGVSPVRSERLTNTVDAVMVA